jgi:hypothetical protein
MPVKKDDFSAFDNAVKQAQTSKEPSVKADDFSAFDEDVKKNLRKFIPYYEEFDANTYFKIFNKEFFRILHKPK